MDDLAAAQLEDLRFRRRLDVVRLVFYVLGAVTIAVAMTGPESLIRREASIEAISRERARLMLEVLDESDAIVRALKVRIIAEAYPAHEHFWISRVEAIMGLRDRYHSLQVKKAELDRLMKELVSEVSGQAQGIPGYGPVARQIEQKIASVRAEIETVKQALAEHGIELYEEVRPLR